MLSNQCDEPHQAPGARRTEHDQQRRRTLPDAASGLTPTIARVQCVIYLSSSDDDAGQALRVCEEAAEAFGWDVAAVIKECDVQLVPRERNGLSRALRHLREGETEGIVTGWPLMISPSATDREDIEREIQQAGGFLYTAKPSGPATSDTAGGTP
ncbi:hypothetical protein ACFY2W_08340 [Streptomyces sp. NPDC001262]|uniref:hypothetical protein n=1 Tax=Streptomyces sp. NPDC001262 TaxID=3364552 RepID=UPI0036BCC949